MGNKATWPRVIYVTFNMSLRRDLARKDKKSISRFAHNTRVATVIEEKKEKLGRSAASGGVVRAALGLFRLF